jgi:hypothetical protein
VEEGSRSPALRSIWVNWQQKELAGFDGRRQPSLGGTSRISREAYVRFCERPGCNSPAYSARQTIGSCVSEPIQRPSSTLHGAISQAGHQPSLAVRRRTASRVPADGRRRSRPDSGPSYCLLAACSWRRPFADQLRPLPRIGLQGAPEIVANGHAQPQAPGCLRLRPAVRKTHRTD